MTKEPKPKIDWELMRLLALRRKRRDILDVFREEFELLHRDGSPPSYADQDVVFLFRRPKNLTRILDRTWRAARRRIWDFGTSLRRLGTDLWLLGLKLPREASSPLPGDAASIAVPEPTTDPLWQAELSKIHSLPEKDAVKGDLRRAALCISGGGIRSATFSLGVLQALARHDLLKSFHYVSTVSGGGYIGSWFAALLTRKCHNPLRPPNTPPLQEVKDVLSKADERREDPEKPEIRHLREYSNYLAPKLGLFSADMFSLIATAIRNVILNSLTLVPIVTASLLFPLTYRYGVTWTRSLEGGAVDFALVALCAFGSAAMGVSLWTVAKYLDHGTVKTDEHSCPQTHFVKWCLAPLFVASLFFCAFSIVQNVKYGRTGSTLLAAGVLALLHFIAVAFRTPRPSVKQFFVKSGLSMALGALLGLGYGAAVSTLIDKLWNTNPQIVILTGPLILPLTYWLTLVIRSGVRGYAPEGFREWIARAQGWLLIVCIGWTALAGVGLVVPWIWEYFQTQGKLGLASFTSVLGWGAAALGSSKKVPVKPKEPDEGLISKISRKVLPLMAVAFLVLLLSGMCAAASHGIDGLASEFGDGAGSKLLSSLFWMFGLAAIGVFVGFFVGINTFSLHSMYGNRLVRAYLGASRWRRRGSSLPANTDFFTGFSASDDLQLTSLIRNKPYPVVNVALNLVSTQRRAWQQRKAESFVMTPLHCGSSTTGYRFSGEYMHYENGSGASLGRAMTISGAAASPNSGYHSSPIVTFLMTLFNLRLGWWAPNPANEGLDEQELRSNEPASSAFMFLQEALGMTTDKSKWVHLSDGGHFENLGLYEMVRRRCHFIVAIDAGCDPEREFEDLGGAIRKCRIDFGIPIEMEGVHVGVNDGLGQTRCAVGKIFYSTVDADVNGEKAPNGVLLYIKPAVLESDPVDVRNYKTQQGEFPHETTGDQFFSESQFESYRALGEWTVDEIWNATGVKGGQGLTELIERARTRYLQSNAAQQAAKT